MKTQARYLTGLVTIILILPAAADTIYSGLLDTPIPTDFAGTTVTITGGILNPFFGGVGVANNDLFQPARIGTVNLDSIQNFAVGSTIDINQLFSTGYGGSQTHVGTTFTAGQEGILGFKLNGANYGWMRVVFTNNTDGAVIKDWAYDNSGAAIVTGRVQQSAASGNAQTVTLSPAIGESFTLGSPISNTGAGGSVVNSVEKTGLGTTTLILANSYTGTSTVTGGILLVNNTTGSGTGSGTVTVSPGATLGGTGSIAGPVIVDGVLAPGASIASLASGDLTFNPGSIFAYEMDSSVVPSVAADFQQVFGDLALTGSVTLALNDLASSPVAFAPDTKLSLIHYSDAWNSGFFTYGATLLTEGKQFTAGLNTWRIHYGATSGGLNFASEASGGHFITLTAIPEPGSWLALGGLVGAGVCLRSRRRR